MEVNTVKIKDVRGKSHSPKRYDVFGNSTTSLRIGEQYQAELPPSISKSNYRRLQKKNSNDAESPHGFQLGKHIPIIWIEDLKENAYEELDDTIESIKSMDVNDKTKSSKQECAEESQNRLEHENSNPNSKATAESALTEGTVLGESGNSNKHEEMEAEANKEHKGKGYRLVPGTSTKTWTETEEAGLTLGLYIFGKNLVQVKRFLKDKEMGDILSFYHGKFYGSDGHRRWSECKNMKGRNCIHGPRIFTGTRLQKLLSRLLPNMPNECAKVSLLQLSKAFSEGKVPLEVFVLDLRASVGLESLLNAVGIGKGIQDLTYRPVESMKSNQAPPATPQLPPGKPNETLTSKEIISYLTGNFTISKSRSSEIFWEAVWPRLLNRGWHSEVPPGRQDCIMSSKDLYFFVPGVENFSRKLVKGNHYFDSHTDVLSKVISEPELIEHEPKANNDIRSEEEQGGTEKKPPQESSLDQLVFSDLMPPIPNCGVDVIKYTVVDTSLTSEKSTDFRELKSLPDVIVENPVPISDSEDNEDTLEEKTIQFEPLNILHFEREKSSISKATTVDVGKGFSPDINGRMTSDSKTVTVPKKQRRMTSCSRCMSPNFFLAPGLRQEEAGCSASNPKSSEDVLLEEKQPQEGKMLAGRLLPENNASPDPQFNVVSSIHKPVVLALRAPGTQEPDRNPRTRTKVDLNLPVLKQVEVNALSMTKTVEGQQNYGSNGNVMIEIAEDQENNTREEPAVTETAEGQQNDTMKESGELGAATISQPLVIYESQPDSTRRRSTRSRAMTTKALEALAIDYSEINEMLKRKNSPRYSARARNSHRARVKMTGETSGSFRAEMR